MIAKLIDKLIAYYKHSSENRMQIHLFVGFAVLPMIGLVITFIVMYALYIKP